MKQRFSSLDIKVISHELSKSLVGLRIHNIYDLSSRIFLFKFQTSGRREHFIIDSGFRCHLTSFIRTTAAEPSAFVRRLRKLLGTRRVTSISQIGTDRIIEFQFSDGLYKLYLEFYAAGNIIITDKELNILAVLRNVSEGAEHDQVKIGAIYSLASRQNFEGAPPLTTERIKLGLEKAVGSQTSTENGPKAKKKSAASLRKAISLSITEYPPALVDHAFTAHNFDGSLSPEAVLADEGLLKKLYETLGEAQRILSEITQSEVCKGYIISKRPKLANVEAESETDWIYDDFHPFKPNQLENDQNCRIEEFDGFNKAIDKFYSSIEGQRLDLRLQERELTAKKKLDDTKKHHQDRLGSLQQAQELNIRKAEAIQANVERVQEAVAAVNGLIAQGMDWVDIASLIEGEQNRGNPVAQLVKLPLKLYENTITLLLGEPEEDDSVEAESGADTESSDSEGPTNKKKPNTPPKDNRLAIDVDLSLSPWANASQYYDQKKVAADKEERTAQASSIALKNAERKLTADLKKGLKQEKDILRPVRQNFWFEKFYCFISSDGYLVLAGKDASQNEMLYSRHLRKGDIFVHADINGASPVIIKNNPSTPDSPVPPSTLSQAGTFSVVTSSAWDSKALMAPWWVKAEQVTKTAPTGDFLGPGLFHVDGEKNFLAPAQLLIGLALVFEITEESKAKHFKHRFEGPTEEVETTAVEDEPVPESNETVDSDSDEDFPDAAPPIQDDSDEDFPEATLPQDDSDEEDAPSNPLQAQPEELVTLPVGPAEPESSKTESNAESTTTSTTNQSGHRHVSAKERRLLKKALKPSTDSHKPGITADQEDSDIQSTTTATSRANGQLPRGKRTKQKKAASKYADQDEDDRKAALAKLGVQSSNNQKEEEAQARILKEQELQATKQRRREQHLRTQALGKAAEEARKKGNEDDDETYDLSVLDRLVGKLLPGDEVISGFIICAPWTAFTTYKYKVKLQPGALKKGKAAREVLGRWQADSKLARNIDAKSQDTERIWPREAELIQGIKDTEVIAVMPIGRVRVMMAGGKDGGSGNAKGKTKSARGGKGSKKR